MRAARRLGWQVNAYCLMETAFHLLAQTPPLNRVAGMKGLPGTYTGRFNRRHLFCGHLFSGRYKALIVDVRTPGYRRSAGDKVHLNPVRAGWVPADARWSVYRWSSYPLYIGARGRDRGSLAASWECGDCKWYEPTPIRTDPYFVSFTSGECRLSEISRPFALIGGFPVLTAGFRIKGLRIDSRRLHFKHERRQETGRQNLCRNRA